MKRLVVAASVLALGLAASSAARANYAVVMFKKDGYCRVWANDKAVPAGPG
jgi:hypothetical protein